MYAYEYCKLTPLNPLQKLEFKAVNHWMLENWVLNTIVLGVVAK
jgi:hypothetical protein